MKTPDYDLPSAILAILFVLVCMVLINLIEVMV